MPNRLAAETSPYLLQHRDNPVDWYPWGDEAFTRAKAEDKPVFLSVGYAACHWCHVMEHESFEDEDTAAYLSDHFVSIKVDREERPDVDQIYMRAVQALTGQGGWPMTVFLTPEGRPFHGGTYFPSEPRYAIPTFRQVLEGVQHAWTQRRGEVLEGAERLTSAIDQEQQSAPGGAALGERELGQATRAIVGAHDAQHGGWGGAPKFPQPMTLEFLLRRHAATGEALLLSVVERTLDKMAHGGIYDQLGGGFHRYSVDALWLVPHFEKMLYDNSQLARVYLHAWQVTAKLDYRRVVEQTLDYVLSEMTHPDGGFYSSQDADSEGEEGKFYVWQLSEVNAALGSDAALFNEAFDVSRSGNWEDRNILQRVKDPDVLAYRQESSAAEIETKLDQLRQQLFDVRAQRPRPGLDDKVVTAWNGLMLAAFAEAARVLGRDDYRAAAVASAEFLQRELTRPGVRLHRTWKGGRAKLNAFLEDYACAAEGLLELYQATFDERWFEAARGLADAMIEHFEDPAGGFFDTSHDHETLVTRPKDVQDNAVPSGNGMAVTVLARLHALTGDARYARAVDAALRTVAAPAARFPTAFAQWLSAADFAAGGAREIAIVGAPRDAATGSLVDTAFAAYRPRQVVAVGPPRDTQSVPLLDGRPQVEGLPTAYVCQNFACKLPVTEPQALAAQLTGL